MNVVLDASAIGAMLLPDEDPLLSESAGSVCLTARLYVPPIWRAEVANLLFKAFRQGRISEAQRYHASERADLVAEAAIVGSATGITDLIDFAMLRSLRAHDATYVELAQRLGIAILTNDGAMRRAAVASGVELLLP